MHVFPFAQRKKSMNNGLAGMWLRNCPSISGTINYSMSEMRKGEMQG